MRSIFPGVEIEKSPSGELYVCQFTESAAIPALAKANKSASESEHETDC